MGGSNSKSKKKIKPTSVQTINHSYSENCRSVMLNTATNEKKDHKLTLSNDNKNPILTSNNCDNYVQNKACNLADTNNHGFDEASNEYEQIIKESLKEMEDNHLEDEMFQEMLKETLEKSK